MIENNQFLGIVKNSRLQLLQPENLTGTSFRLTRIQMQEARAPESAELDLLNMKEKQSWLEGVKVGNGFIF